jgi:uncharacterized membrane protein YdjX (TVP38/TMEM64 family)
VIGRTIARDWVARKVEGNPKSAAIDRAVEREGFRMVVPMRLSPIVPFNQPGFSGGHPEESGES